MQYLKLRGGKIFDPKNGIDGEVRDLWIAGGKVVPAPATVENIQEIDLQGRVVMPGGVDMHCHIAGPKVNTARKMQPELFRAEDNPTLPTIWDTGYRYLGLGYTTAFDAAVSPLAANHVQHEISDLPAMDGGFFVLVGNNHYVFDCIEKNDGSRLKSFLGWLLNRTGGYAPKIVNPGGVELWKSDRSGNVRDLDCEISRSGLTAREILLQVTTAANELGLPHPVHVHTNNLGIPGNWETTLETMKTLAGQQAHLTHIQFHSYGGGGVSESSMCSKTLPLAQFINEHPELSVDVGQVAFGSTTSMTGDGPLGYYLANLSGKRWFSCDTELESGCGISPIQYKNSNFVHALQWAIGLEWYLAVKNPWQVVMSTDHPNGGSFTAYPQIIRLLMDRNYRWEKLAEVNPRVLKHSQLADMDREYTLGEIAVITRAGPAKLLGLEHKGHLGEGADADVTVYDFDENYEQMFELPYLVFKSGELVVEGGEFRSRKSSTILSSRPEYDRAYDPKIEAWFNENYSIPVSQFGRTS
jgi:formylmethanofuran dehydrogenase subunit A